MSRRALTLAAAGVALAAAMGRAQTAGAPAPLVLTGATVIDGRGGPPLAGRTIVIRDGRIARVEAAPPAELPPGARVIDLGGRTVLPGLIDTHLHLPPDRTRVRAYLRFLLEAGVTSARDMAGDAHLFRDVAAAARAPESRLARLDYVAFWAGATFFAADRRPHGSTQGREPGQVPWFLAIGPDRDLEEAVADAAALGAHALKLYSDLPLERFRRAVGAAHGRGLRAASHVAVFPIHPADVVEAGVDAVSHAALLVWAGVDSLPPRFHTAPHTNFGPVGPYDTVAPDHPRIVAVLEQMRRRGTVLDATVSTIARGISPAASAWALQATALARRIGVAVSAGTDRPEAPAPDRHPALFDEIELLVSGAGFTPLEAITAATLHGARALGAEADRGTVEPGKLADLIVTGADPSRDIRHLRRVELVIKGGEPHDVADVNRTRAPR